MVHTSVYKHAVLAKIKQSNKWKKFFEWKKVNFFFSKRSIQMNVQFKWFCTIFWLKHNRKKYFFFHKSQFAVSMAELEYFEIKFVSRWFHIYRDIWNPKLSLLLEVFHEQGNVNDPFTMAFEVRSAAVLTKAVIVHIPREISCFFYFLWNMVVS